MLTQFIAHIKTGFPFLKEKRLLLACSGGLDSVVLAHLCIKLGLNITLAHCNFNLRGLESDEDELFVRELAKQLNIAIQVKSFHTKEYAQTHKGSVQMAARELRYQWFHEIIDADGFDFVLTAHHADDSLETFVINLSRGTGIDGLSGIPAQNGRVFRPLLNFSRNEILEFAKAEHIKWREDSSNAENKYLRNKIRHEIVPKLKELHPTFLENFKKTQEHLIQTNALVHNHMNELRDKLFVQEVGHCRIRLEDLAELHPIEPYLYQLFNGFGFTEWDDVKGLLTAMSGKKVESKTHSLIKDREHLLLSKNESKKNTVFIISEDDNHIINPVQLKIEIVKTLQKPLQNVIYIDKEKLNYPLLLRNWEKGDYFYPFGMQGKKKLSKFFKDEKTDVLSKEKQWLLCSGNNIVWVVGKRLDERFKVNESTKSILKITLSV